MDVSGEWCTLAYSPVGCHVWVQMQASVEAWKHDRYVVCIMSFDAFAFDADL